MTHQRHLLQTRAYTHFSIPQLSHAVRFCQRQWRRAVDLTLSPVDSVFARYRLRLLSFESQRVIC